MNVLSLFDGISCGQLALQIAGIAYDKYYASEIDKHAIKVTQSNFPETVQLGSVTELTASELPKIDLLIGGSPCQNLSPAVINKAEHNQGLDGEKSKLFYEYLRLLQTVKPKYFLLENVAGMKDSDKDIISECLGVEPVMINSSLVSAQDRRRYYWTNIPNVTQPEDKCLVLADIVQDEVEEKYWYDRPFIYNGDDAKVQATMNFGKYDSLNRVYNLKSKAPTLTTCGGGHRQKKVYQYGKCRKLTPLEYERLQTVPDNYTDCISDSQRYNTLGNGWTVDVIAHIFKGLA